MVGLYLHFIMKPALPVLIDVLAASISNLELFSSSSWRSMLP